MPVQKIRWPQQAAQLNRARKSNHPRLVLYCPSDPPEMIIDPLEDYETVDALVAVVEHRCAALSERSNQRGGRNDFEFDAENATVTSNGTTIALSPIESIALETMIRNTGTITRRDQLASALWPDRGFERNAVDVVIRRLRKKLIATDITITTIRSRGYMIAD